MYICVLPYNVIQQKPPSHKQLIDRFTILYLLRVSSNLHDRFVELRLAGDALYDFPPSMISAASAILPASLS